MFKRRTLFVLGAGASAEVDLPLGTALAERIRKKMDIRFEIGNRPIGTGDMNLFAQVTEQLRHQVEEYQDAAWLIRDGLAFAQSIDDFLDLHRTNEHLNLYGKAAIVKSVLEAEQGSRLYFNELQSTIFDPASMVDTWLVKFMYMLGRGVPKENVREIFDNVSFIVFNYDRCVEFFLRNALRLLYRISDGEAQEIVDDLSIIHPYGVVGRASFGATNANCLQLAAGIKTYTEQAAAAESVAQIQTEMQRAECIVFLGFAYHSQNMTILQPAEPMKYKPIYGTAFKMSDADVEVVSNRLGNFFASEPNRSQRLRLFRLENKLMSADLFDYYARSLSGGD